MSGRIKHQEIFVALRKAGLTQNFEYRSPIEYDSSRRLEHFVELIAAKAAAAEREACAELCEQYAEGWAEDGDTKAAAGADCCAQGIRARGEE